MEDKNVTIPERERRKQRLMSSRSYQSMRKAARYMDQYYIDGIVGLVPLGIGDVVTAVFAVTHVYFCLFRLRSVPLTLAVLNNVMRDVLMGMLPFFVGDIIDFLNKAHVKNMRLIDGYLNDDPVVMRQMKRKAWISSTVLVVLTVAVIGMVWLLIWLTKTMGTAVFS